MYNIMYNINFTYIEYYFFVIEYYKCYFIYIKMEK